MITGQADPLAKRAAWAELGRRGDLLLLDLAELPQARNRYGGIPGLRPALRSLAASALPRARTWIHGADPILETHAVSVLVGHGTGPDGPALLAAFQRACDADDWYTAEQAAPGLARLRVAGAAEPLRAAFEQTPHSHAREEILPALTSLDSRAGEYVTEGLLDCQSGVRAYACRVGPSTRANRKRLAYIRTDPLEDDAVQAAAANRL